MPVITDFNKVHPPVNISTGLFCFSENVIQKICESEEKQLILDVIIIA